jgi:hypothetical protein
MSAYTLLLEEKRTARTKHLCVHCAEVILPGEIYVYTSGEHDDGWKQTDSWHEECRQACLKRFKKAYWESWEPGKYIRGSTKIKR